MKAFCFLSLMFLIYSCSDEPQPCSLYDVEGYVKLDGRYHRDQFIDTIFVFKDQDNESYNDYFDTFIVIDSSAGKFYYGTELVQEKNTHKLFSKGIYRFKKNINPTESFNSKLYTGSFTTYTREGSIYATDFYTIKGDSSYIMKPNTTP